MFKFHTMWCSTRLPSGHIPDLDLAAGFSEDHGGSASVNPPTNATATPQIVNLAVIDVDLSVLGPSVMDTLAEAPIVNLTLRNITLRSVRGGLPLKPPAHDGPLLDSTGGASGPVAAWNVGVPGWVCKGQDGTKEVSKVFASGTIEAVSPPLGGGCNFAPVPAPVPNRNCTAKAVLGCFNDSSATMHQAAGWTVPLGASTIHDRVTRANCAAVCDGQRSAVAAIDQGNHCLCGGDRSVAASSRFVLPMVACQQAKEWPCTGSCCG
eukprot:SAG31_NODE_6914_length_1851_cov_1.595890_1_plen_264_part_10